MLPCPSCSKRLRRVGRDPGPLYLCPSCGGRGVGASLLNRCAGHDVSRRMRHQAGYRLADRHRTCPHCAQPMSAVRYSGGGCSAALDVCRACRIVWFDPGEYDRVIGALTTPAAVEPVVLTPTPAVLTPTDADGVFPPQPPKGPPPLPHEKRRSVARAAPAAAPLTEPIGSESSIGLQWPQQWWQWVPAIFGMPIEISAPHRKNPPVLTWLLAALTAMICVVLMARGHLEVVIRGWGFVPDQWSRHGGATILTSFFLHAGLLHLLSNLYFLLVFGDNVEDHLGHRRYALLLLMSHVAGTGLHAIVFAGDATPCVGASAGILGVASYYAIVFPRARVGIFLGIFSLFRLLRLPVMVALAIYALLQVWGAYGAAGEAVGVAYWAHLGGLGTGVVWGMIARFRHRGAFEPPD